MSHFLRHRTFGLAFGLAAALGLWSCKEDADSATGLIGTWKLTDRQCFCPRTPVPNETLTLTATAFAFRKDGRLDGSGTYTDTTVSTLCGGTASVPGLRFAYSADGQGPRNATYTISGNSLTLDYGSPCDAPRDTYERLP